MPSRGLPPAIPCFQALTGLCGGILDFLGDSPAHAHIYFPECVCQGVRACSSEHESLFSRATAISCCVSRRTLLPQPAPDQQRLHADDLQLGLQKQLGHLPEAHLRPCGPWGPPDIPHLYLPQGQFLEAAHFLLAVQLLPPVSQGRREAGPLGVGHYWELAIKAHLK